MNVSITGWDGYVAKALRRASQVDYVGRRGEALDKIKLLGLEYGLRYIYNTINRLSQSNQ